MPDTLSFLSGKFIPPSLPEIYAPRRVLLADLYAAAAEGFVCITAPAGSGKSVSALLWLTDCKRKPLWIGLDEYDNTPAVFYKLIAIGLYSTQPNNKNMRAILEDDDFSASPVEHTVSLISEMRADMIKRVLVLDDMHLITNSEIARSLPFVIKRLPQTFVTMILTRTCMPKSFNGLVKNEIKIITSGHLRFTPNEIHDYFKSLGKTITPQEMIAVQTATDGWAIGINTVAQSGDFHMYRQDGVFEHFFEKHIWNTWDDSLRSFCLKTSVADEIDPELAEKLSGRADAGQVLNTLSHSNSFVRLLHGDVYRYHHLLLDFLRGMLDRDSKDTSVLYKTAANHYKEKGDYSTALRFWLDSGDYKGADRFLFLFMFNNHRGDIAGYADFLRMYFLRDFSDKAFQDFPALHVCCAWYYYMSGRYAEYEHHSDECYKHITRIALYDPKFVEFVMLLYITDHRFEILGKIKRLNVFVKLVKHATNDGIIRYIASCTHNLPFAHKSSFDFSDILSTPQNVDIIQNSAFMTLLGDQSDNAISLGLAGVFYERNNLEAALAELNLLAERMTEQNNIELRVSAKFLYHSCLLKMEHSSEAAALAQLTGFIQNSAQFFLTNLEAYKVKLKLLDCDKASARSWLDSYHVLNADRVELFLLFQHFTTARAHMVLGDEKNARRYLTMLREFGQNLNRVCDFCEASVLLSALDWVKGNKKEAVIVLEAALLKLRHYGYTRIVIDEGAAILPVLKHIAVKIGRTDYSGSLNREFVSRLIMETHRFAKNHKGVTAGLTHNEKPLKLSKQQLNMLTLLSKGYSNAMIVAETGLKITTVKTHTAVAYQKLGVNNAMDALLKARDLGFIE